MPELHLETPRLDMLALEASDERLYCDLFTDTETMRHIGPCLSRVRAVRSFNAAVRANVARPRRQIFFRVVERTSMEAIGICCIQSVDLIRRRAELGVMLRHAHCGKGVGKEALSGLVDYAFRLFPIEEIWVQYQAGHLAAERLVISTGFSPSAYVEADENCPAMRVWSAFRQSWNPQAIWKQLGEKHVECDRRS